MSTSRWTAIRPDALPVEPGVLRDRHGARLRARLHVPDQPRHRPRSWRRSRAPPAGRLPFGEDHHAVYRRLLNHRIGLSAICEDLPEAHNRVTLDPVLKDSNGIPAPRIDYTLSENSRRMMAHGIARATRGARGRRREGHRREAPILNGGWHLLGTARMGNDPERSVVNGWGRSHDVKNLFIVDGSIWVTVRRREPDLDHPGAGALDRRQHQAPRRRRDPVRLIIWTRDPSRS